jgi:hypothetical protein
MNWNLNIVGLIKGRKISLVNMSFIGSTNMVINAMEDVVILGTNEHQQKIEASWFV